MRQYYAFKKQHPDCVLFFRMGDFYEMFDEDARLAHQALGITLTERTAGVPMAGVPYHSVETYLRRMMQQGYRVAVCEQTQDPAEAKGVVERAVQRVLTPGTLVDEPLLEEDAVRGLAAICFLEAGEEPDARVAIAVADVATGAFTLLECAAREAPSELARRSAAEILFAENADGQTPPRAQRLLDELGASGTPRPAWHFRRGEALESVRAQYGVATVNGFGLTDDDPALAPAGALIRYLHETQAPGAAHEEGRRLRHLAPPTREQPADALVLDNTTLRALEVERTMRTGGADGSLLGVFSGRDACRTSMGRRLLRDWLRRPLAWREQIEARQACVATLVEDQRAAGALADAIANVQDAARIAGRLGLGRATPRDLVALGRSLAQLDAIAEAIDNAPAFAVHRAQLQKVRASLAPLAGEIAESCVESPPAHLREGGLFQDGVDAALDEARSLQRDAAAWLANYQSRLVQEHDLPGIKVGYNKVFGYYIELTRARAQNAPESFIRKQTLKNAERYITPELKEFEDKVTTAESRAIEREQALFKRLCEKAASLLPDISAFAQTVAELDVLASFARRALHRGWVRPVITDEPVLDIAQGRHPVLEESLGSNFVPNDASLGSADQPARLALLTGPNMAGKSTYIRQVALLVLLAHTGSFIPAERAAIGLTDRIFTRVGADDALHAGQSTFMVEMTEAANILHHATGRSLVILDEIGRGTSTLDGLSLAWAIAEELARPDAAGNQRRADAQEEDASAQPPAPLTRTPSQGERAWESPRTLFATHYHELTTLEERLPGRIANLHVAVREWGDEIVFLHRILPGRTDQSYGIHVAKLAGLPTSVVRRARELLDSLAVSHEPAPPPRDEPKPGGAEAGQFDLFTQYLEHPAMVHVREIDLDRMTPMQAFDTLRRVREMLTDEADAGA